MGIASCSGPVTIRRKCPPSQLAVKIEYDLGSTHTFNSHRTSRMTLERSISIGQIAP